MATWVKCSERMPREDGYYPVVRYYRAKRKYILDATAYFEHDLWWSDETPLAIELGSVVYWLDGVPPIPTE